MKQEVTKRLLVKRSDLRLNEQCSVIATLKQFATKWKPCILCYLSERPLRYNELYRIIPNISRKMLSAHLKEMENDGLIVRSQYDEKLQRVEYALSEKGKSLLPILDLLQDWGMANLKNVLTIREMIDETLLKKAS
jgi:DNA-binding HxlR family transcriptional regulator